MFVVPFESPLHSFLWLTGTVDPSSFNLSTYLSSFSSFCSFNRSCSLQSLRAQFYEFWICNKRVLIKPEKLSPYLCCTYVLLFRVPNHGGQVIESTFRFVRFFPCGRSLCKVEEFMTPLSHFRSNRKPYLFGGDELRKRIIKTIHIQFTALLTIYNSTYVLAIR